MTKKNDAWPFPTGKDREKLEKKEKTIKGGRANLPKPYKKPKKDSEFTFPNQPIWPFPTSKKP